MNHLTDIQLETYFLSRSEFSPEAILSLETHVGECFACRKNFEQLRAFYSELDEQLKSEPTQREEELAAQIFSQQVPQRRLLEEPKNKVEVFQGYAAVVEPKRPLLQRFVEFARFHPVQFGGSMSFAFGLFALLYVSIKPMPKDTNPSHAKVQNSVLFVYNNGGETLWTKSAVGIPDVMSGERDNNKGYQRFIVVEDIDGDGVREILLAANIDKQTKSSLNCYNFDGTFRWENTGGESVAFGEKQFTAYDRWRFDDMVVFYNEELKRKQLFVLAQSSIYFPGKLLELNPRDGNVMQTFWNVGAMGYILMNDIDNDGKKEIFIAGINNAYNCLYAIALNPSHFSGCGPATKEFYPSSIQQGNELYYLLLRRTKLGNVVEKKNPYNLIEYIRFGNDNNIIFNTRDAEVSERHNITVLYTIGTNMEIKTVAPGDSYIKTHELLLKEGKINFQLTPEYWEEVKHNVQYWDGEKFVNTPTKNKLFSQKQYP
ncbi:MAG: hypothetical protein KGZ58_14310 [Ignavibacteriales bacterium]|nr:hypothetical protein [Ignavibacteriales bacterium]